MTRDEFTKEFADLLNLPSERLSPETNLTEISDWDSVAYLSAMVMIDEKLGIQVRPDVISSAQTFSTILDAVSGALMN
jgi:acyl carrier protein